MSAAPIFIGGTGRSGTTLLQQIVGTHPDILSLPFESRFIIDTGGIIDLISHLSDCWTPVNGDMAISRFEKLMLNDLDRKYTNPYRGFAFSQYFGETFYSKHVKNFIADLSPVTHRGRTALRKGVGSQLIYSPPNRTRAEILSLCSSFIKSLFGEKLFQKQKKIWAEKTPHNILHIGLLRELFPDARFICIHRDPRDVVASLMKKQWAPNDVEGAMNWLSNVYERFWNQKELHPEVPLIELTLESLVANPEDNLRKIEEFLELKNKFNISGIDLSLSNQGRWKQDIKSSKKDLIQNGLSKYINKYGYK